MALKPLERLAGVNAHQWAQLRRKHWVCTCGALCMLCLGSTPITHTPYAVVAACSINLYFWLCRRVFCIIVHGASCI
jgi:hypothetical protein